MATKLDWQYDDRSGEYRASVPDRPDLRIRAVRDEDAQNPFTDGDMNWPIIVRSGDHHSRDFVTYDNGTEARGFGFQPFRAFNDALLLHWQMRIAIEFNSTVRALVECHGQSDDELPEGKVVCRDAEALRDVFEGAWDDLADSEKFDFAVKLYAMCDIVAVSTTVNGYSQGDWADVLVIGHPDAIERFGCQNSPPTTDDLQGAAALYGAWAWGDVYGHVVERIVPPEDEDDNPTFEETDEGSCWGFYGADFDKSGLEESALSSLPERVLEDA